MKKLLVPMILALAVFCGTGSAAQAESDASASASCSSKGNFPPASYVTSIAARGLSCRGARRVVKAYHACRRANGGAAGHCNHKVLGFRCVEGKRQSVPGIQYSVGVSCRKGSKRVNSTYTQNV